MLKELLLSSLLTIGLPDSVTNAPQGDREEWIKQETTCLAKNIYFEARNQGTAGHIAVAAVTLNRVADDRYPNTICEVVYQGPHRPSWKGTGEMIPVRHKCQFSWYCDGKSDNIPSRGTNGTGQDAYKDIYLLSELLINGTITTVDITEGATHYHADYVRPAWRRTLTKTVEIEDHIFYRWEK